MKNLQSYEEFIFEEMPCCGFDGTQLKVGSSVISFDGYSGIIISKESVNGHIQYRDHKGVIRISESCELIEFDPINEDLQWWEVTKGILAADAIKAGLVFAGGGLLAAGLLFTHWRSSIAKKIEKIQKDKKYAELKEEATKIADKFNSDEKLISMLKELEKYPYQDMTFVTGQRAYKKAKENNASRRNIMKDISKYVKSQLTPDEQKFFVEINDILRDKPLTDNTGNKVEEDVVSDPNRTVGTGTLTATSSDTNYMVSAPTNTTDPSSGGDTFFR